MKRLTAVALTISVLAGAVQMIETAEAKRRESKKKNMVVKGILSTVTPEAVVVDGKTILLRKTTKFEDFSGKRVALSAFVVGDCVKVKIPRGQPVATAREMELEDDCSRGGDDDDSSSTSPTPKATPTPKTSPTPKVNPTPKGTPNSDGDRSKGDCDDHDDKDDDSGKRNNGDRGKNRGDRNKHKGDENRGDDRNDDKNGSDDDRYDDRNDDKDDDKNDDDRD